MDPNAATAGAYPSFSDLTVSPSGALYFTGGFANTLDLGAGPMSTTSTVDTASSGLDYNLVIARLEPGTGRALWSKAFGDKANQAGCSVAANADDIVLISGFFSGNLDFGPAQGADAATRSFSDTGSFPEVFLAAFDGSSGAVTWARSVDLSASGNILGVHTKVAVDPSDGNFVLCASPSKAATDLIVKPAGGRGDALIAKLEARTGQVIWAQQYGGAADESCNAVTADTKGKVYFTGRLTQGSSLDFGKGIVLAGPVGKNQKSVYVAQLNSADGTVTWGKTFNNQGTTTGQITASTIATDGTSVWIGGGFTYGAKFDEIELPKSPDVSSPDAGASLLPSSQMAFVAALDANSGVALWAQNWGTEAEVTSLALTSAGSLIVGGDYVSGMNLGTGSLPNSPGSAVPFVAKLVGTTGQSLSARGYASSSANSSWFQAFAVDRSSAAASRDAPYAIGVLGDVSNGIDVGAPVGELPGPSLKMDGAAFSVSSTLFLLKFNP